MELVLKLLYGAGESLIWGIVFLFVAFIILPQSVMDSLLKRLRPDLTSKPKIISKLKTILNYILNDKNVVIASDNTTQDEITKENELQELLKEKKLLESNLFFLDMIKNLSSVLFFSVSRTGYSEDTTIEILQESMYYLAHYGNNIEDTSGMQNQKERLHKTTIELEEQLTNIMEFKQTSSTEDRENIIAKFQLKTTIQSFNETVKDEYTSTENQLNQIKQLLAQKFINFME